MSIFQGLIFLLFGIGLLVIDYRSLSTGWLPFGPSGLRQRLEFRRHERPVLYWSAFMVYAVAGLMLVSLALKLLAGEADPLPLR